jgi:hypothetical protein
MLMPFIGRLFRGDDLSDNPFDYERLAEQIELFTVSSQIHSLLAERGRLAETPEPFRSRMKAKYEKVLYQNLLFKRESDTILQQFEYQGIPVIPLKGTRFAERYFGHFAARGTSDIDVLIRPCDIKRAIDCVKALGYTEHKEERRSNNHCSFTKRSPQAAFSLSVELHWSLEKDYASDLDHDRIWQGAEPVNGFLHVKELSPVDTFYYICLHGARHQMDSVKYFIDIVQLIERIGDELDISGLLLQAAKDRTLRRMLYALQTVYRQFPHLSVFKPLPTRRGLGLWSFEHVSTMRTGNKSIRYYAYQLSLRLYNAGWIYDTWKHRLLSIPLVSFLFPPTAYIVYTMEIADSDKYSRKALYRMLYRRRFKRLSKLFSKRIREGAPHVNEVRSNRRASG